MPEGDPRPELLGLVETRLRADNPDLTNLWISAQSHYSSDGLAFIDVFGVDDDTPQRRAVRSEAGAHLGMLGCKVELEPGRDVYTIDPICPVSRHEAFAMLVELTRLLGSVKGGNSPSDSDPQKPG